MDDELLPPEEQQPQPGPQGNRFLDAARDAKFSINSPTPQRPEGEPGGAPDYATSDWAGAPGSTQDIAEKTPKKSHPDAREAFDRVTGKNPMWRKEDFKDALTNGKGMGGKFDRATNNVIKRVTLGKKWWVGGAGFIGLLVPIFLFFMWMMLFKNVHIKNLYVTYRWAQFNRGMNQVLKSQLEYAKANPDAKMAGNVDSTVAASDSLEDLTKKTNAERFSPDVVDPDDAGKVQAAADDLTKMAQSVEGASETALKNAGTSRNVKPAEGEDKAKANVDETLRGDDALSDPPDTIADAVDDAKDSDKPPAEALDDAAQKVMDGGGGWRGKVAKAGDIAFIATMYCIFSDMWRSGKDQLAKIAVSMSMVNSQELNKTASCQQRGDCNMAQVSAVSEKYDNGEESFMDSCGASRAQQTSNPDCEEIDSRFVVNGIAEEIGGASGVALTTADTLLDPPFDVFGFGTEEVCSALMHPAGQAALLALDVGAIVGTGGGWKALGRGVVTGGKVFVGTAGGKALIATFIAKYTGDAYEALNPVDMGNLTDMGNMATASATCKASECVQIDSQQQAQLDSEYRTERIAANSKRSILEKFFDTNSPDSVTSRVALNAPSSPSAVIGRIQNVFASISNPLKLSKALGNNSLALSGTQSAYAATNSGISAYGLENGIFVPAILVSEDAKNKTPAEYYKSLNEWGQSADLGAIEDSFDGSCKSTSDYSDTLLPDANNKCLWTNLSADQKKFKEYKGAQKAGYFNAILNNNQTNLPSGSNRTGSGNASSVKKGIDTSDPAKYPCPANTPRTIGDVYSYGGALAYRVGLCDLGGGIKVNASAAQAFYDMKQAAAFNHITLTGGGYRSYDAQVQLRKDHGCPDLSLKASACSPPTARPGESNHEEGLAVDFDNSHEGDTAFIWLTEHAAEYGIKGLKSEPWHWSVDGG